MIGKVNGNTNFPHNIWLIDKQVSNLHRTFASNSEVSVRLSKTPVTIQSGGFIGNFFTIIKN